jgi:hypothetical protein
MNHLPFEIKVNALITRANGDQEDLGAIGSIIIGPNDDNSIDKPNETKPS